MKENPDLPSLAQLRAAGFGDRSPQRWYQVGPANGHEGYPDVAQGELWLYRPTRPWLEKDFLADTEQLRPVAGIAALVEKRPLEAVIEEAEAALKQLLYRAHCGDERAIRMFAATVRRAVNSLRILAAEQAETVRGAAKEEPRWPVLISLNPQDISIAKNHVRDLCVGQKATMPTKPGQKVDRRNYWTKLASWAVNELEITQVFVPIFEKHAANSRTGPHRLKIKIWGTVAEAAGYDLGEECIVIADWEKKCVGLSKPVTKANFEDWWQVVKGFLLEYWHVVPPAYASALKQIGSGGGRVKKDAQKDDRRYKEDRQRSLALAAVRQALKSSLAVR